MAITARYPGRCQGCPNPIAPGDLVEQTRHGWAHQACTPSTLRRDLPGRSASGPSYTLICPTCGAEPGASCTSAGGKKRPLHPARSAASTGR